MSRPEERHRWPRPTSPTVRPAWLMGESHTWSLAQELRWLGAQSRPDVLRGYLLALPGRVAGFDPDGHLLTAEERAGLHGAALARLARLFDEASLAGLAP